MSVMRQSSWPSSEGETARQEAPLAMGRRRRWLPRSFREKEKRQRERERREPVCPLQSVIIGPHPSLMKTSPRMKALNFHPKLWLSWMTLDTPKFAPCTMWTRRWLWPDGPLAMACRRQGSAAAAASWPWPLPQSTAAAAAL